MVCGTEGAPKARASTTCPSLDRTPCVPAVLCAALCRAVLLCGQVSFHRYGDYFPGTGAVEDVGYGKGRGYCVNVPLKDGMDDESYRYVYEPIMTKVCAGCVCLLHTPVCVDRQGKAMKAADRGVEAGKPGVCALGGRKGVCVASAKQQQCSCALLQVWCVVCASPSCRKVRTRASFSWEAACARLTGVSAVCC